MERSDYLILVNKQNKIPDNWEEIAEFVEVKNSFGKYLKIEKETLEKFNELREKISKIEVKKSQKTLEYTRILCYDDFNKNVFMRRNCYV
jgi:uncharacterized protein Yka (UPF0111/DUF47 family)